MLIIFYHDFAAGTFHCTHGEIQGDIVLFGEAVVLAKKQDDDYLTSHQRIERV